MLVCMCVGMSKSDIVKNENCFLLKINMFFDL